MKQLVIIGAGGLGQEVLWAAVNAHARHPAYLFRGFADDAATLQSGSRFGLPLLGTIERAAATLAGEVFFCCAIGGNRVRQALAARAEAIGWKPVSIIDPSVLIGPEVTIGPGSYVGAMAIISPAAQLGRHVLVNHACSIGHDSRLGDFSQACPGGRISGAAELGTGAFVGSNGVVAPGVRIADWATVGAASFAMRDVPAGATAVGNPARIVIAGSCPANPAL